MVFVDALRNAIPENAELTVTDGEFDVNVVINHTTEDTLEWTISQAWNAVYAQLTKERSDAGLSWPDPKWVLPIIRYVERSWQKSAKRTMTERIKFSDA